jgi:hypothetical protein
MNPVSLEEMVTTKALPDEVATGHAGRLTFLNECPSAGYFFDTVRVKIGGPLRPHAYPDVCLLASLNNQSVATYTSKHTMLPFTCFPLTRGWWNFPILHRYGLQTKRAFAYFCEECAQDDRAIRGFSYWRRSHQLIGRQHCAMHPSTRLTRVLDQEHPFDRCPSHWLILGATTVDDLSEDKRYAEWRRRLVDIEQLMLDLGGRYDPRHERPAGVPTPRFRLHDSLLYDMGFGRRWERELRPKTPGPGVAFPSADGPARAIYLASRFSSAIEALDACELVYVGSRRRIT